MNRIDALFSRLKSEGRRALMPFVTAGDPDLPTTAALIAELVAAGAHMVEVGIPYSDPIADGPVIAASYHRALERGVKLAQIFQMLRTPPGRDGGGPAGLGPARDDGLLRDRPPPGGGPLPPRGGRPPGSTA